MSEASVDAIGVVPPSSSPAPATVAMAARPAIVVPRPGDHLPALDGLRGLAILAVLLLHFTVITPEPTSDWPRLLWRAFTSGWVGVDLFFVLSGFLITGILLDAKGGAHYFRNFYMRRTLRIFPLYYGVLVLVFLVRPHFPMSPADAAALAQYGQWWYWTYLTNVLIAIHHGGAVPFDAGHLWSLAVEEQFYLFWPLVVFAVRPGTLKRICVGLMVGALALRVGITLADDPGWWHLTEMKYALLPTRADTLAFGGLLALLVREPHGLRRLVPRARIGMAVAAVPLAVLFVVERGLNAIGPVMQTLGFSALVILFGCLLVVAIAAPPGSRLARAFSARWLMMLGRYSYAMYLFHQFIRGPLWRALSPSLLTDAHTMGWAARAVFIAVGIAVTLVLAIVSWNLYEKHFLRLKDLFPYERRERSTVLPAP